MSKNQQGFTPTTDVDNAVSDNYAGAIKIEDIQVETIELGDYKAENLPPLPIGIFMPDEQGNVVRLRDIKLRTSINTGDYDLFIARLDPQQGENPKKTVDTLKNFLGGGKSPGGSYHLGTIESIGGIEITEIASKKGYSSASELISNMYLGDVATLMFATRLKTAGLELAVDRTCPVPQCKERCRSMQNMGDLKIKTWEGIYAKPVIRFDLVDGIHTSKHDISYFLVEPLKLHQLNLFIGGGRVPDIELMKAMICAIPELSSTVKKSRPFTEDLYQFMTQTDIGNFRDLSAKIQPGPGAVINVICACGQEEFPHQINWARTPRDFLYQSQRLLETDE